MRNAAIMLCLILGWSTPTFNATTSSHRDSLSVSHVEAPTYPSIALAAQVQGTVEVTVEVNEKGEVSAVRAFERSLFDREVERNVRTWKFSHLPVDANFPITHTVRYEFTIEGEPAHVCPLVIFDLPDRVRIIAHPPIPQP